MISTLPVRFEPLREYDRHRRDFETNFVIAHDEAKDAARRVLEDMPLGEEVSMPHYIWEYWCDVLGEYDSSLPSGTRIGKRWCRTETPGFRFIGTYLPAPDGVHRGGALHGQPKEMVRVCWTRVTLTFERV